LGAVASAEQGHAHLLNELAPLQWLTNSEVHHSEDSTPTTIITDSTAAIQVAQNPVFHKRMKHTHIRHHFIRGLVKNLIIRFQYGPSATNVADMMVKANSKTVFRQHRAAAFGPHIPPPIVLNAEELLRQKNKA
jgi:hypothetical protein